MKPRGECGDRPPNKLGQMAHYMLISFIAEDFSKVRRSWAFTLLDGK